MGATAPLWWVSDTNELDTFWFLLTLGARPKR